eukprot:scaffold11724_cov124-Isochrysis_galbana.AAC.9
MRHRCGCASWARDGWAGMNVAAWQVGCIIPAPPRSTHPQTDHFAPPRSRPRAPEARTHLLQHPVQLCQVCRAPWVLLGLRGAPYAEQGVGRINGVVESTGRGRWGKVGRNTAG